MRIYIYILLLCCTVAAARQEGEPDQWWVLRRFSQFASLHAALMASSHLDTRTLPALPW
jgi:hypothetical protein